MKIIIFAFCLFLNTSALAAGFDLHAIWLNRQGLAALKSEKPEEAFRYFSEALAEAPDRSELHYNLGLTFEAMGQPEKAVQAYQTADTFANSPEVQFVSRFNQGALLQKAKKTDEALDAYHQALDVNPNSHETKINIELLIQEQKDQQKQKGGGEGQDKKPNPDQEKKDQQEKKDPQDQKDKQDQKPKEDQKKEYAKNKPQPKPFKSEELTQGDVNKILGELRNQEQRIRSEYNKREVKERPRGKDW